MNSRIKYIMAAAAILTAATAGAQNNYSGYFLDSNVMGHTLNPAFGNSENYVSMPALGDLGVGMAGNLNLTDVLYNVGGKTVLFTNPGVSAAEVMGNIGNHNRVNANVDLTVLSAGFKAFGGYNTVGLGVHAGVHASLPKSIFSFLKEGITNKVYDITDLNASARGYASLDFGHSRSITPEWRVGAKMKLLFGVADFDANLDKAHLTLNEDDWQITTNANIHASMKGFSYKTKISETTGRPYVDNFDVSNAGLSGFGLGFDLGAVYDPIALPDWKFSAAILDLGFISWSSDVLATTNGDQTFNTSKYTFGVKEDAPNSFSNEWEDVVKKDLAALYELQDAGDKGGRTTALHTAFNIGVEYTLPMYRPLKFGLLNTTRIAGVYTSTDFRLSANVTPIPWFSAGINGVVGTYGAGFGWIVYFHPPVFDFFISMDNTLGRLAKQGIPLNSNAGLAMGMSFRF